MSKAKKGVYAAAITPIGADGEPDLKGLVSYCRGLIAAGCDGVAPLGTTGEAAALPFQFRQRVPDALAASGIAPDAVILGAGSPSLGDAVAIGKASLAAGYSNLLVLPPYYTKEPSDEGLYDYYSRIIDALGDNRLHLYLYHIPQVTMVPISHALVARLRDKFGGIIAGIKDSSGNFDSAKSYVGAEDFDVFPSTESVLSEGLAAGCAGVISGSTNISAALARDVLRASGAERAALQAKLTDFRQTIQKFPLIPAVKQVHAWRTGDPGWLRMLPPLRGLSAEQTAQLRREMERLGQIGDARDAA
ncbi:dihydrodipicolinate synthase family protein [Bradyrhizobium liaoningense]|uniref:dihydrodipicolinate synthase family protein n=1 Tax=Bradyrhizobium liaoningense TaxID=43992 RepID=UPI001BA4C233|nr:dihydrodipicolinate synthase family protein [Bradyrhizobium liaoningense]MBR0823478.1 dihydrodipicolinate synthase family protein [Bradyrhizobium liaoningense]